MSAISPLKSFLILSVELSLNLVCRKRNNWSAKTLLHTLLLTAHLKQMWRSLTVHLLFKCSPPRYRTLSRTTITASSCLTFLDNFSLTLDGWILLGTFISQTAWRPEQEANGAKVNVVRCYLWHHYLEMLLEERWEQEWPALFSFQRNWKNSQNARLHLRWQCGLIIHRSRPEQYEWMHPRRGWHTSISSCCRLCETRPEEDTNTNYWQWRRCTCNLCCWQNKGGRAVGCIWNWKTFQTHCSPRDCFKSWCRQIKNFACLSRCNWSWHGLILWLERKTEGLKHMDCIPYSGVGLVLTNQICHKMHLRRLSNLLCSRVKRTVQWQQWMQQGKSCYPNDAKPSRTFPLHRMLFVSTLYVQPIKHLFGANVSTEHQSCHLHPPGDEPRTKDNHESHYGQHFVRLIHCGCKQGCKTRCKCAAANLPCTALCHCGGDCNAD